ncbi:MAG TPA: NAD(P)-dependent oxidoreductase [Thermoanaerobaculia bacterium]|nr:NAD(P)-dependent oxidoreductase [Thermoanaerobaculia bacterium]
MTTRVAFLGLGSMGLPMARRLLAAGLPVTVWNRTRRRAEELAAPAGLAPGSATVVDHPADVAQGAGGELVAFTMLADDAAVEQVALGAGGLVSALPAGAIHVSCSTIGVALSRRLAEAHARAGQGYVVATVLGRPEAAAAGKLFVLAAGAEPALVRCRPLLHALGQRTMELGDDPVAANTVKLVCNFMIAAVIESLGEGLALAERSGIPARQCLEVLTETVFGAPIYKTYGSLIAEGRFEPAGFKLPLGFKDVRLVLAAGEAVQVPLPVASLVRDHMLAALARGQQDLDWSSFVREVPHG